MTLSPYASNRIIVLGLCCLILILLISVQPYSSCWSINPVLYQNKSIPITAGRYYQSRTSFVPLFAVILYLLRFTSIFCVYYAHRLKHIVSFRTVISRLYVTIHFYGHIIKFITYSLFILSLKYIEHGTYVVTCCFFKKRN